MVSQTSQVKQQSSTLLQQQSMLLSPLTDSIRLSHFCAQWTLIQDLLSFESIHFMQLFVFLKSFSFYHSITMHHFISSSWRNVTSSLPNVQISTDTNVQCIELSQNDPAECHAAGAWYPDRQRRCSSRIFAQHCGDPPLVCHMVFHQCNAVWHSVEYLFGKWHEHIFLLKLPLLCTDTLRAMRQESVTLKTYGRKWYKTASNLKCVL